MSNETSDVQLSDESRRLADLLRKHYGRTVIYTGAGISTSAAIPDYRGTNGLWRAHNETNGKKKPLRLRLPEASFAKPTYTHMAIAELVSKGYVRYVVSQNVDGLHLRSGLPRDKLSELHGNLFIEQCMACDRVVYRSFDVGETTGKSRHLTGRVCPFCVPASSVDSPSNSVVQKLATGANSLATRRSKSSRASLDRVLAFKRAATSLRRIHAKRNRHNCSLPLMRDVIVHYFERQPVAGQAEIYRVDRAVAALYGSGIGERIKDETAGGPSKRSRLTTPSDFHSWPLRLQRALTNVPLPNSECGDVGESPASLILVIGSSLSVLRNYAFLWPVGLGRCVGANPRTSRKRTRRVAKSASRDVDSHTDGDGARCQLAVINLLPTCKDGLATFLSRRPCDEVLRETVELGLGLSVPEYDPSEDQLLRWAVPLQPEEQSTRTRPDILHGQPSQPT